MVNLKNIRRFEEIIKITSKHGFGIIFDKINSKHISNPEKHIRQIFEELGGSFIKLGQLLSLRPDLIPLKYCYEFEKLQHNSEEVNFKEIKKMMDKEFSRPLKSVFKSINPLPLASGSIAQIHRAELVNGKEVILKIRKPKIKEQFEEDFEIIKYIAIKLKKFLPKFIDTDLIINEFEDYTRKELNFKNEMGNMLKFKEDEEFRIPKVYSQLSTNNIIVMEYVGGILLSKKQHFEMSLMEREKLVEKITTGIMKQVFIKGCFHGDPHPGNILLVNKNKICLLDFGIVGEIDEETKTTLVMLLYAITNKNLQLLTRALKNLGIEAEYNEELKEDVKKHFEKYYNESINKINFSEIMNLIFYLGNKYNVRISKKIVLLSKTIITTESICQRIYPHFNFIKFSKTFLKKNLSSMISTKVIYEKIKSEINEYGDLILTLPKDLRKLVQLEERREKNSEKIEKVLKDFEINLHYVEGEFFFTIISFFFMGAGIFLKILNKIFDLKLGILGDVLIYSGIIIFLFVVFMLMRNIFKK